MYNSWLLPAIAAGTRLGSTCRPDTFDNLLDVAVAYMPMLNRPLTMVFVSRTSPAAMGGASWLLDVKGPNATSAQSLGPMQYWPASPYADNTTYYAWQLTVPGLYLSAVSFLPCVDQMTDCVPLGACTGFWRTFCNAQHTWESVGTV